jgi:hypothetical protein
MAFANNFLRGCLLLPNPAHNPDSRDEDGQCQNAEYGSALLGGFHTLPVDLVRGIISVER